MQWSTTFNSDGSKQVHLFQMAPSKHNKDNIPRQAEILSNSLKCQSFTKITILLKQLSFLGVQFSLNVTQLNRFHEPEYNFVLSRCKYNILQCLQTCSNSILHVNPRHQYNFQDFNFKPRLLQTFVSSARKKVSLTRRC